METLKIEFVNSDILPIIIEKLKNMGNDLVDLMREKLEEEFPK